MLTCSSAQIVMQEQHTMPELGFERRADDAAFGSSVLESLDDIYNSRNVRSPFFEAATKPD